MLQHLLSESEFLSDYGVRAVSRIHAERQDLGHVHGIGRALIEYVPGESTSGLFGGNSNWRGPIWMPTNYVLVQAIERYHRFLGDDFKVPVPCLGNQELTLNQVAKLHLGPAGEHVPPRADGRIPALPADSPFQRDPAWRDLLLFNEYFHGETGLGLGAMHQTGWTGSGGQPGAAPLPRRTFRRSGKVSRRHMEQRRRSVRRRRRWREVEAREARRARCAMQVD